MRSILFGMLLFAVALPFCARGDAKYYRYSDDRQLYYTRDGYIYRYSDDHKIYYFRDDYIYRYSDDRKLYYIRNDYVYRYSDDHKILYYRGDDLKLIVFMIIRLVDM